MYTNKKIFVKEIGEEVHVSRIIASWLNAGGKLHSSGFNKWLKELGIEDEDREYILRFLGNGKLELQQHGFLFLQIWTEYKND